MDTNQYTGTSGPSRRSKLWIGILVGLIPGLVIGVTVEKSSRQRNSGYKAMGGRAQIGRSVSAGSVLAGANEWKPLQEMSRMQAEIDNLFNWNIARLRMEPQLREDKEFPGYSLSFDVRDLKDRFEVRAFLPDAKTSDVNVKLEGKQTLMVSVSGKETEKAAKGSPPAVTAWEGFEQTIQLPEAAKAAQMQVVRKDHELLITLPKE